MTQDNKALTQYGLLLMLLCQLLLVSLPGQTASSWDGIAKEQARVVLPEGNTKTRLYMNGTLRSWVHYIELRSGNGTQKEHMEIARDCAYELKAIFPMIMEFINE